MIFWAFHMQFYAILRTDKAFWKLTGEKFSQNKKKLQRG